jgi:hypothetical protein
MNAFVGAIEDQALENTHFRQVLLTAEHTQLAVMCLRPGKAEAGAAETLHA